jgi:hypothetical protein
MLALDKALGLVGELYVWGDHADPNRFYYAPGPPSVARAPDGELEYRCILWQAVDGGARATAGALLSFTSALSVSADDIATTLAELKRRGGEMVPPPGGGGARIAGEPVLWPAPLLRARATLASALTAGDDALIEQVLAEVDADLVPPHRATFALSTEDPILARLIEALVRDDGPSPIGVRYELTFAGLRPAVHARIHADYQRALRELAIDFKLGVAYQGVGVKVGIEHATRRLRESGALEVEVIHFTDDAALVAQLDASIQWFQEDLRERFFQSALHPPTSHPDLARVLAAAASAGTTAAKALGDETILGQLAKRAGISPDRAKDALGSTAGGGAGGAATKQLPVQFQLGFSLRNIDEQELRTQTITLDEARAERRTLAPQGLLLFGGAPGRISSLDLGTAFPELHLTIRPLGDFAADGVERLIVEVAWPDTDSPTRHESYVFEAGDAPPAAFVVWTHGGSRSYRYRVQVHFVSDGPWPGEDLAWSSEWMSSDRLDLAIHPLAAVPRREIEVSLSAEALEGVSGVEVHVDIDDAPHVLALDATTRRAEVRRRLDGPGVVTVGSTWRLPEGGVAVGEPVQLDEPAYMIGGPWRSRRRLRVVPMLAADVLDAVVTITPDEAGVPARVLPIPAASTRAEPVEILSLLAEPPPYRVDVLIVRGDGTVFSGVTEASTDPVVLVTDRDGAHRRVQVKLLAPPALATAGVIAVLVQLLDDADEEVDRVLWTESARADGVLLVPVRTPFRYRVRISRYAPDGTVLAGGIATSDAPTLLIPAAPPPVPPVPPAPAPPPPAPG